MKVNRVFLAASAAVVTAVAVSSCTYDPYYSRSSHYSGYGSGYGYGSRNFTTTYFVRTSDPRWGYDPYARCYYDYSRRCYYDPYLRGYYPSGYRPNCVQGAPHPYGYRTGSSYIAAPSNFRDTRLNNYQQRDQQYRSLNNSWSRNVQINNQLNHTENHRHQYDSRSRESNSPFSFGNSQTSPSRRSTENNRNTYINDTNSNRRSSQNFSEPKIETPRPRSYERKEESDRSPRSNRSIDSNQERGRKQNDLEKSSVMRQPENHEAQHAISNRSPQRSEINKDRNPEDARQFRNRQ